MHLLLIKKKNNNTILAHKYINRFCSLEETDAKVLMACSLLRVILDSIEELSHLLKPTVKVTERDYLYNVWLPLPRKLFSISGNLIRLKFDESALSHSTTEKQDIYSEEKGVVGFKIDLRCIFDHGEKEFDFACLESCLSDADEAKVRLDGAKLLREARSNLVNLQYALPNDKKLNPWFVQVTGLKAMFSTIVYDDNDLYVSVSQFMIDYPSCIEELESFSGALVKLFSFAFYVEETVHALK